MPISTINPNYTVDPRKGISHNLIVTNQFMNKMVRKISLPYKKVTSCECWPDDYKSRKHRLDQAQLSESVKTT